MEIAIFQFACLQTIVKSDKQERERERERERSYE